MVFGVVAVIAVISSLLWFGQGGDIPKLPSVNNDDASAIDLAQEARKKLEARGDVSALLPTAPANIESSTIDQKLWPGEGVLFPLSIGDTQVQASIATTTSDRVRGLSGTRSLPDGIVKLFVFPGLGQRGIWMKDMNYPIDIIWLDDNGVVIHYELEVKPDTYPKTFSSPDPAMYVIETRAGFVESERVVVGTKVTLPPQAFAQE